MQAILRDLGIEEFIETPPVAKTPPTEADIRLQKEWKTGDAKARTQIELVIRDVEMIHISGATTAREMWKQLKMVKNLGDTLEYLQHAKHCIELQPMSHLKWLITFLNYENYRRNYIYGKPSTG